MMSGTGTDTAVPLPRFLGWTLPPTFRSLGHRNFRLLWSGTLISSSGDWMDQIAFNWLVYQLTGSAIALGIVNLCRMGPVLIFTLVGGVIADRMERRRLMFVTQTVAMLLALLLAVLVSTNLVQFWMVIAIAIGRGVTMSFNQPARQSLISDLVPPSSLMNAIALNSATLNLTRVMGPAIGGTLIATTGVAGAFYLNAASFLAVLYCLALMQFPARRPRVSGSIAADLFGGIRYLAGQPALRTLVLLALLPMVFGMPYMTMLTVFASDVLKVGGGGLGLLTASSGVGAMSGALFIASSARHEGRGRFMLSALVAFGASLVVFSLSHWVWLSFLALISVGFTQQAYMSTNNTLIQTYVDKDYRGRVLSTLFLNRGMVPLGATLAGFGAEFVGVQIVTGGMAAVLVIVALVAGKVARAARELS
ncbi:MAG: MFS transporter [Chloroflexi bacterium]|nr:MFS transporter [Chloroflexota bacterium]